MKNTMLKILSVLLLSALLIAMLSGCAIKGKTWEQIQKEGKIVIATSPDFPPFEELQADGSIAGIEVDILNKIFAKLGIEVEYVSTNFDAVLLGVQAAKYDVGMSGITVTEKRQKNMLFTSPYCMASQVIVVKEGSEITSKAALSGKKVSVQTATTAEEFCMANGYTVSSFDANSDAEMALVSGKVDAWVIDDLTAKDMVEAYNAQNEAKLVILEETMTSEPYAFAFAKGSETLVEKVDEELKKMIASGEIAQIFEDWSAPYYALES